MADFVFPNLVDAALKLKAAHPKFNLLDGEVFPYDAEIMRTIMASKIEVSIIGASQKLVDTLSNKYGFIYDESDDLLSAPWNSTPHYILGSIDGTPVTLTESDISNRLLVGQFDSFYIEDTDLARKAIEGFEFEEVKVLKIPMLKLL